MSAGHPAAIDAAFERALGCHEAGQLDEAEHGCAQILAAVPDHVDALHLRGAIANQRGRHEEAVTLLEKASGLRRADPVLANNLGNALIDLGEVEKAERSYRRATKLAPGWAMAHNNLGNALRALGRLEGAVASCRRALSLEPQFAAAHNNLANALLGLGRREDAERSYRQALAIEPRNAEALANLAGLLRELGRREEAAQSYREVIALEPGHERLVDLADLLRELGRMDEAVGCYRGVLERKPGFAEAHNNLGIALQALGRLDEAEASCRRALDLKPEFHEACNNLGITLQALGRLHDAEAIFRRAVTIKPDFHQAYNNLGATLADLRRPAEAESSYRRALELEPGFSDAHGNLLFLLNYDPEKSAEEIFAAYREYDERFGVPMREEWRAHGNDRQPERRLRVGYVSPDFRGHACRYFIEPMFAHHDPAAVEVFAYSNVPVEDAVSARMKERVAHWIPTASLDDAQLAERIRADGIDILVDLAGHTGGNRLLAFARKPAPVSVTTLGFGCTTGLSAIDWYLTDSLVVPEGFEHVCSEKPWRIRQCLVYRPAEGMGEVSALPAMSHGHVTFGTLTRAVRINHRTVRTWAQILKRVPGSHLKIDSGNFRDAGLCAALTGQFAAQGIGPERLELGFHSPPWDVLRAIDIGLDCFPHNSGTTLFESLYMGIPFVTFASRPPVGRLGASILTHLGHPEWIAHDEAGYVDKAVALAADLPRLAALRSGLRARMQVSPLMDETGHVRDLEAAYRAMWRHWCAQTPGMNPPY